MKVSLITAGENKLPRSLRQKHRYDAMSWLWFVAILFLVEPGLAGGQAISVQVRVVNVSASVRDLQGALVANLEARDFSLEEDGRPQQIKYFMRESDLPLSLGLLVDVSESQNSVLREERRASALFLEHMITRRDDKAFVIRFGRDVDLLQGFTSSIRKLNATLDQLTLPGIVRIAPSERKCAGFSLTPLYDAIYAGSEHMEKVKGTRKALVVLTDGVDHNSCVSLRAVIEEALRAETIVYVILFAAPPRDPKSDGTPMEKIAYFTGGNVFEVVAEGSLGKVYDAIESELRQLYSLGYTSDRARISSEYRKIRVTVKRPGFRVTARDGYWVTPEKH